MTFGATTLTILRVVGIGITIAAVALLRREQENTADLGRANRPRFITLWIAVALLGAGLSVYAIFSS